MCLRVQLSNDVVGIGSELPLLAQAPLDESQQWLVANSMEETWSLINVWQFPSQHFHQENPKAEDVHLGGLLGGVIGFRGGIGGVARTNGLQLLKEIDGAIV